MNGLLSVINKVRARYVVIENRRCCSKTRPHQHSREGKIHYEIGNTRHGVSRDTPSLFLLPDVSPTLALIKGIIRAIEDCLLCFSFATKRLQYNIRSRLRIIPVCTYQKTQRSTSGDQKAFSLYVPTKQHSGAPQETKILTFTLVNNQEAPY